MGRWSNSVVSPTPSWYPWIVTYARMFPGRHGLVLMSCHICTHDPSPGRPCMHSSCGFLSRAATLAECTPRTRKDDQLVRPSPAQLLIYTKLPARRLWVQANYCAIRGMLAQDVQHVPDCPVRSSLLRPNNAVRGHIQERRSAHAEYLKTVCVHPRTIRSAEKSTLPSLSLSRNGHGQSD